MQEMNGLEATGVVRALDGPISKTPIIRVTANAIKRDQESCLGAGMSDYLSKPVSPHVLLAKLEAYHDKSALMRERA